MFIKNLINRIIKEKIKVSFLIGLQESVQTLNYLKPYKETKQKSAGSHRNSLEAKANETLNVERPNSEMNIHNSNALRNSFILEEDEEELEEERQNVLPTPLEEESLEKSLELPFPELVFINLADNQVSHFT